jgi:hypothetical protein
MMPSFYTILMGKYYPGVVDIHSDVISLEDVARVLVFAFADPIGN